MTPANRTARPGVGPTVELSPQALRERLSPGSRGGTVAPMAPWTPEGLIRVVGMNGAALVMLIAGWYQASGEVTVRGQLTWLNLGLAGLGVAGWANGTWLWRGRQAIGLGRVAMLPHIPRSRPRGPAVLVTEETELVAGPGMSRYHLPGCPFVAGKTVSVATRAQHERHGLVPCEVCQPWPPSA